MLADRKVAEETKEEIRKILPTVSNQSQVVITNLIFSVDSFDYKKGLQIGKFPELVCTVLSGITSQTFCL